MNILPSLDSAGHGSQAVDLLRRRMLQAGIAVGGSALYPWRLANAQVADKSSLGVAYHVDIPTWDPGAVTVPSIQGIYQTVFDSPLRFSADLKLEARQIKSWRWLDDKDTRLEVTLRDDILFQDGSKLTMEDLKFSVLDRPQNDKKLMVGNLFNTLVDVEIQSPVKGVLVYRRPTPTAPLYLAFLASFVVPKAYFTQVGQEGFNAKPIGAGPYRMVEHQRGSRIVLEAFDKYWGKPPPIKNVVFQIASDPASRVALIESSRVQLATQIPMRELQRLSGKSGIITKAYPFTEIYMLRVPSYLHPFDDDHVRAAMHLAIDKEALSKAFYGGVAKPLSVMTPQGTPGDVAGYVYPFDRARAAAELKAAGYGPDKPIQITLLSTNGTFPSDYDMARALVQMWKAVGFQVNIEQTTPPQLAEAAQSNKLTGCVLYSWANNTGDPENYAGKIFDPRVRASSWKDMTLAPRIESLLTEVDESRRIAGFQALNKEASDKSWAIPLLQSIATLAYNSALHPTFPQSGYVLPETYYYS